MTDELVNFISNVGFPITISIALFYQLIKTNELMRDFQTIIYQNTTSTEQLVNLIREEQNR